MKGKACSLILCILLLLLIGCQKNIRTVVMKPDTATSQSESTADDGSLKEIHSFETITTTNGKNTSMIIRSWMNDTHIWCETYENNATKLNSVDDSYGFIKALDNSEHSIFYGTSPDGRYALILSEDKHTEDKTIYPQVLRSSKMMLYDANTGQSTQVMQFNDAKTPRYGSVVFSNDGRYLSFLAENYIVSDVYYQQLSIMVYDIQTHTLREFIMDPSLLGLAMAVKITDVKSMDEIGGWLIMYDKKFKSMGNAVYVNLIQGKALLAYQIANRPAMISNLLDSSKILQSSRGLQIDDLLARMMQSYYFYEKAAVFQTADGKVVAVNLETGEDSVLSTRVDRTAISPNGKRIALSVVSKAGVEIYTATIGMDEQKMPVLQNKRLVYTGKNATLGFWNQDGSKLGIFDVDEKNKSYYRVLTFNITKQ